MDYLSWPDYVIIAAFLIISLGIGVFYSLRGDRQRTTSEFIMASRSLSVLPTAISLFASFFSAVTVLGAAAEMYSYGSQILIMELFPIALGMLLIMQVAVPWLYPLKLVSINEYLELRFKSKFVRILAAMFSILMSVMYMGTTLYAASAASESVTGIPMVATIPVVAGVAIAYTALGGMRAVIWTDVFQCLILAGGIVAILIKGLIVVGGFHNVFSLCSQTRRLNWLDWSPDPTVRHTFWGFNLGIPINWLCLCGFSQPGAQRYMATKTLTSAKLSVGLNVPIFCFIHITACLMGLVVVSYYASIGCDPLANGEIRNANQLLSYFVLKMFTDAPGFSGLFLATLYGGSLSSVSSSLSGSAANIWEDILQSKLKHWTDSGKVLLNRCLVVLIGAAGCGMAFFVSVTPGPVLQIAIAIFGAVMGPTGGMFLLGGLNRHANAKGVLIGGITSITGSLWLTFGSIITKQSYPTLPQLSTDGCSAPNNLTFSDYSDINNSSSILHVFNEFPINSTMTYFNPTENQTIWSPPHGLNRFYSISYQWYTCLWVLVTLFVGSAASYLFRDSSVDKEVDERLLIHFRECFKWKNYSKSDVRTEKRSDGAIGADKAAAAGEMEELVPP